MSPLRNAPTRILGLGMAVVGLACGPTSERSGTTPPPRAEPRITSRTTDADVGPRHAPLETLPVQPPTEPADAGSPTAPAPEAGTIRIVPGDAGTPPARDAATPTPAPHPPVPAGPVVRDRHGLHFVLVPAGSFTMGSPEDEPGRMPLETAHPVTLTRAFEMSATEVTQAQYRRLMGSLPGTQADCADCPVSLVDWPQAVDFVNRLSEEAGLPACWSCSGEGDAYSCWLVREYRTPYDCPGYRLPTEAEWEYAARAGTTTAFYNGPITEARRLLEEGCFPDAGMDAIGWYCANADGRVHPVGGKLPNAWGLFDMAGNAAEWVADWEVPPSAAPAPVDPFFGDGFNPALRGGCWYRDAVAARSAALDWVPFYIASDFHGIRVVRTIADPGAW